MRFLALVGAAACALAPAAASAQTAPPAQRYDPAPWWMAQPVITQIGYVRFELRANRATFRASFQAVEPTAAAATRRAAERVRAVADALRAYGPERARVETTISIEPLFEQYRDREGNVQENRRADQVERYSANANVNVEVRDVTVLERVYATVLGARPTSVGQGYFRLAPGEAVRAALYGEAVEDAARRARRAAEAAGSRLGAVKVIDPTGRACQTDILARAQGGGAEGLYPSDVEDIVVTGSRVRRGDFPPPAPPPPPPPPVEAPPAPGRGGGASLEGVELPLQAPLQELTSRACVVYALG
jgi:uncharacterized protein YggE